MIDNSAFRSRRRTSALLVGVLLGGVVPMAAASAREVAECGSKLSDWLDQDGVTTYLGSKTDETRGSVAYKIAFSKDRVTMTTTEGSGPEVTDASFRLAHPGWRLVWERRFGKDADGSDRGGIQFELKRPTCAGGGTSVTRAVATVASPSTRGDDTGPDYCESAYRVGEGKENPPRPASGVCGPGS